MVCFVFFIITLATKLKVTKGLLNYYYEIFGIVISSHSPLEILQKNTF